MQIWKWEMRLFDKQYIDIPAGAKLLDVQMRGNEICIWALCDQYAERETRTFGIYATGQEIPDDCGEYVATFQMDGGSLVFHVFELTNKEK